MLPKFHNGSHWHEGVPETELAARLASIDNEAEAEDARNLNDEPKPETTFYQPGDGETEYSLAKKGTDDVAQA
jgi:hypothetical protein